MKGAFGANSKVWLSFPTGDFFSAATVPACGVGGRTAVSESLKRLWNGCVSKLLEQYLIG